MHSSIQLFDEAAHLAIRTDIDIETLADDCQFTEGPDWERYGFYVFSDITANTVYKLVPGQSREILIPQSGTDNPADEDLKADQVGSNGLAHDVENGLLVC